MDVEPQIVIEDELEDGELSDHDVDYTPLERPSNILAQAAVQNIVNNFPSDDEIDNSPSSDSDSDSDNPSYRPKKPKLKLKSKPNTSSRKNKYDIWSSRVQEDVLAETLVNCDVSQVDRSRDVESYDYPQRKFSNRSDDHDSGDRNNRINNKRNLNDRSNIKLRLGKRPNIDEEERKGSERMISNLIVSIENTEEEIATDIANKLFEEKDDLIKRVISVSGKQKAIDFFKETQRIEKDGGMLIMNQTRRRTPGGVYFFLLKHDSEITDEQRKLIFLEERQNHMKVRREQTRKKRQAQFTRNKEDENLPNLLTRAELCVQKLTESDRTRKESEPSENVTNPPPSPVTDGKENSSDEMADRSPRNVEESRTLNVYFDDILDIGVEADDMDVLS